MTQTDYEPKLSFATLNDDGFTMLLNGDEKYSVRLPMNILRKKATDRQESIETEMLNGCNSLGLDYVSMDNIQRRAKEVVDLLYERTRVNNSKKKRQQQEEEEDKTKRLYVQKYHDKSAAANVLYEAVLIAGKPYFVSQGWDVKSGNPIARLYDEIPIPDARQPTLELLPPEKEMYLSKSFEFESEDELNKYLKLAMNETLDTIYRKQKTLASKYIDANNTHLTMLAADDIFTYFQDKLGQTHYDEFVGDNDTGKTANLIYLQNEGYRAMLDVDITPANIYGFLGSFEEGQGIILEDEADDIDRDPEKMKIYKSGYNAGKKVTRTDLSGFGGRKIQSYNTFCFKAWTAEQAPNTNKAKGLRDRTFDFHCTSGSPEYDIQEVTNPAGDLEFIALLNELNHNRKLLFAFRLLHYQDPLPNIELSVKNREKQLCKPLLRLFQNAKCQGEIGEALADKIAEKRGIKLDTLEAKILSVIVTFIIRAENQREQRKLTGEDNKQWVLTPLGPNQIPTSELFEEVRQHLGGEYRRDKDKSFDTEEHGVMSHDKIRRICVDKFGAEPKRSTGGLRYFDFKKVKLEKSKAAYAFPGKVVILEKNVSESGSDAVPEFEPFSEDEGVNQDIPENEKGTEVSNNTTKGSKNMKEIEETGGDKAIENNENRYPHTENDQKIGTLSLQESYRNVETTTIEEITSKAMHNGQGNNKGYFTKDDWVYTCTV